MRLLFALLMSIALFAGYIYFTGGAGFPQKVQQYMSFVPQFHTDGAVHLPEQVTSLQASLPENTSQQLQTVGTRTGELGSTVGQVLGEAVKTASSSGESTLQERAFDYGRYLYCQQVVKEYEARTAN